MECKEYAVMFKALSDVKRVAILQLLTKEQLCGCQLLKTFQITQPTLSHHMSILIDCGLVLFVKRGKYTYYSINEKKIERLKTFFTTVGTGHRACDDCGAKF